MVDINEFLSESENVDEIPPCQISIDEEGYWFHEGDRILRPEIIEMFYENLTLTPDGRYLIEWRDSRCILEVADTAFVITRVDKTETSGQDKEEILLTFRHIKEQEPLDPRTLRIGKDNVMYCQVRAGRFPARFSRPAYYQLAQWVQQNSTEDDFYLELNGVKYPIEINAQDLE